MQEADHDEYEIPTLTWLFSSCLQESSLEGVCYIHTKGISQISRPPNDVEFRAANSWRHFLEWGTLDNWRRSILMLQDMDLVSVNYKSDPWPHISGNMWWAKAAYVKRLCAPSETQADEQWPIFGNPKSRYLSEKWIGTGSPKVFSYFGLPYRANGKPLNEGSQHDFNLYREDIEPFYRDNAF